MTAAATSLDALAAGIEWPDAEAAAVARSAARPGDGRLAELREWLAATRGVFPPPALSRPRCLVVGEVSGPVRVLADSLGAGVDGIDTGDSDSGIDAGIAAADAEVDAGADLLVVVAESPPAAPAVVVSLLTSAEPVALLPRGAAAVDTAAWISRAEAARDTRRAVADLRRDPAALLAALGDAVLATATGLVLQAVLRRTPLVLDGTAAVVAGLLAADLVSRAARWWQVADARPDPVHARAVSEFDRRPLLDLGLSTSSGTAGLLTLPLLRVAQEGWT